MSAALICLDGIDLHAIGLARPPRVPFAFARGVQVTNPSGIHEAYQVVEHWKDYWVLTINVSVDHLRRTFVTLLQEVRTPGYFALEVGTPASQERALRQDKNQPYHKDVYYRDGISHDWAIDVFNAYDALFVHDGRTHIAFGSHRGIDEVYLGPYKILRIFTDSPGKYVSVLDRLQFPREERIKTVWNTFTARTPGRRISLPESPQLLEHMLPSLQERGLYFAHRRVDIC